MIIESRVEFSDYPVKANSLSDTARAKHEQFPKHPIRAGDLPGGQALEFLSHVLVEFNFYYHS